MMLTRYFDKFWVPIQIIGVEEIVWKSATDDAVVVLGNREK